jgi:hypothetical protein
LFCESSSAAGGIFLAARIRFFFTIQNISVLPEGRTEILGG